MAAEPPTRAKKILRAEPQCRIDTLHRQGLSDFAVERQVRALETAIRPELWRLYNTRKRKGESLRVFPLSNWTELDVWHYIHLENIPVVPLYFAKPRPVVRRDGAWILVDDDRMPIEPGEIPEMREVRFRTLGCYPLSGAIDSHAATVPAIIQEILQTRLSERQGRMIDHDQSASMEKKKVDGYFWEGARERSELRGRGLPASAGAPHPAALHHLRQRGRRQVDADRPAAVRLEDGVRGSARGAGGRLEEGRYTRRRP
jgi:hypothetical protein